jgi:hypothetical protein
VNGPEREAKYSSPSNIDVKNAWRLPSTPPIRLPRVMIRCKDSQRRIVSWGAGTCLEGPADRLDDVATCDKYPGQLISDLWKYYALVSWYIILKQVTTA